MGEPSAFLMRSLSQPSPTSSEEKQRNPLQRALSTSISFGRFMSESLDWEKWSTFTHNRYLEEVEKYKRPGSVAEKKAYFEARYKRRKAETLLEQENAAGSDQPQPNVTNEICGDSSADSESAQKDGNVVTRITKKDEVLNSELVFTPGTNACYHTVAEEISEDAESLVEKSSNQLEVERDVGYIMLNQEDTAREKGAFMGDSASSGEKKPAFSPAKLSTTKNNDHLTPNSMKTVRNSTNKKRPTPRSLHRLINFDAHAQEAIKASSPGPKKIVNSRLISTHSNKSKDSVVPPTSTRASSMNSTVKHPGITPRPDKSYPRSSGTRESKAQPSIVSSSFIFKSEERAAKRKEFFEKLEKKKNAQETGKQQLQTKSKEKPKIDFRDLRHSIAFNVERNGKVSGKTESPNSLMKKEKPKIDSRDLRRSIAFKFSPNGKVSGKTESPNSLVKKIPKTQRCDPELKGKEASKAQVEDSRPTWRFQVKTDGSKDVTGKNNRPPIYSAKSLAKKRLHENVSPNIQP
ncbi:TPX2 (targeting protein for Xklp2) protein family [Abeliophyllum distichum]|uniref:TPX2 (Targeting protein for Xklp2) protein family n=1 Tax=Abeliophyllum distichum TaxID=126358 RepID=A0ABD1W132_9LAMI